MLFYKTYVAFILIVAVLTFGAIGYWIGAASTTKEPPQLCYAETVAVNADNVVFAQTKDGNVWAWQENGETPIADLYVIALGGDKVENAIPVHIANVVEI